MFDAQELPGPLESYPPPPPASILPRIPACEKLSNDSQDSRPQLCRQIPPTVNHPLQIRGNLGSAASAF